MIKKMKKKEIVSIGVFNNLRVLLKIKIRKKRIKKKFYREKRKHLCIIKVPLKVAKIHHLGSEYYPEFRAFLILRLHSLL